MRWLKMPKRSKLEIAKTHSGYYRVYKNDGKTASPYSPREFSSIGDARKWLKNVKTTMRKSYKIT